MVVSDDCWCIYRNLNSGGSSCSPRLSLVDAVRIVIVSYFSIHPLGCIKHILLLGRCGERSIINMINIDSCRDILLTGRPSAIHYTIALIEVRTDIWVGIIVHYCS